MHPPAGHHSGKGITLAQDRVSVLRSRIGEQSLEKDDGVRIGLGSVVQVRQ